ncbi:hypothetical protein, partial [Staphylococcus condimenti]|uniref:hypothetical protein n=1 Tax=Staphylococcus condimenti TaxID=70255 RepID=UPI0013EE7DA2
FTGEQSKSKTLEHVYTVGGVTPEEVEQKYPGGPADAGTVKSSLAEKQFLGNEQYEGWHLAADSADKSFTIVQPEEDV